MSASPSHLRAVPAHEAAASFASMAQMVRRFDGWANLLTGLGTARDKRLAGGIISTERLPYEVLVDIYRSDAFAAKAVNRPVEDMTRKWFEVKIEGEKDACEALDGWLEDLEAQAAFQLAGEWKRAYGGAGILIGINGEALDSRKLSQPLNPGDVREITHLTVFSARELQTVAYYSEPQLPNFGKPAIFRIVPQVPFGISGQRVVNFGAAYMPQGAMDVPLHPWGILPEVHESRILQFDGIVVDRRQRLQNWGWGDSILQRIYERLRDFDHTLGGVANLLTDFAQAILKIPGLTEAISSDNEGAIVKRAELLDMTRSIAKMILLDGGEPGTGLGAEEFKRETTSLTSVPETIDRLAMVVAAAADMPVTLMFGQSPKGLGNEGESDVNNWYDHVAHLQRHDLGPNARKLVTLGMQASKGPLAGISSKTGEGLLKKRWSVGWLPLKQMSEKEEAEIRKLTAETDAINVGQGIYTAGEASSSHYGGDAFSQEIQLETEDREAFAKTDPAEGDPATPQLEDVPGVDPEVAAGAPGPTGADLQALALNGAQIAGMVAILAAVRDGSLPPESAVVALQVSFPAQISEAKARLLVNPIEVKEPPEPPDPLELAKAKAAGGPPGMPGAKPPPGMPKPGGQPPPERQDFDDDQPRDESGMWSASGGGEARTTEGHLAHAKATRNLPLLKEAHARKMKEIEEQATAKMRATLESHAKEMEGLQAKIRETEAKIAKTERSTARILKNSEPKGSA